MISKNIWTATVITLFPEVFPGTLGVSVIGKALSKGIWRLNTVNLRDFSDDRFKRVDAPPYGGGGGMIIRPDVVSKAIDSINYQKAGNADVPVLYLSPKGDRVDHTLIKTLSSESGAIFLCGRYEGIDHRVIDSYKIQEISLGDFIIAGGEVAAMAIIESCVRLLPNVLGNDQSAWQDSFVNDLLEYSQYTVPEEWNGQHVPEILFTGNHEKIEAYKSNDAKNVTRLSRPDLWARYVAKSLTKKI